MATGILKTSALEVDEDPTLNSTDMLGKENCYKRQNKKNCCLEIKSNVLRHIKLNSRMESFE